MPSSVRRRETQRSSRLRILAGTDKLSIMNNLAGPNPFTDAAALCDPQIVVVLKIEPKLRGQIEILPQPYGGVGTDRPISPDHFIDARKTQRVCQFIGAYAHGFHELSLENIPGVNREHFPRFGHANSAL